MKLALCICVYVKPYNLYVWYCENRGTVEICWHGYQLSLLLTFEDIYHQSWSRSCSPHSLNCSYQIYVNATVLETIAHCNNYLVTNYCLLISELSGVFICFSCIMMTTNAAMASNS